MNFCGENFLVVGYSDLTQKIIDIFNCFFKIII